jgi:hypothetical protein
VTAAGVPGIDLRGSCAKMCRAAGEIEQTSGTLARSRIWFIPPNDGIKLRVAG